ncbi:MAG: YkvA family protein [Ruthenibacterium sp.]
MDWKARAKQLKTDVPAVFLALKKKETPPFAKILAAVTVAYALSPIDLIPDFIPVLGYLDDVILLPALIALTVRQIPPDIFAQCRTESEHMWQNGKPKKWYYALPILLFWALVLLILVRIFAF